MPLPTLRRALASRARRRSPLDAVKETLEMVHADVQAQLDRTERLITSIPGIVQAAVTNAEAAKDSDHADDVAALTKKNDELEAALAALHPAAPEAEPVSEPAPPAEPAFQ